VDGDPNKKLSADEIAALFAAGNDSSVLAEPDEIEEEPEPAEEPEDHEAKAEEEVKAPVVDGDPNKKLSADEIAALFAAGNDSSVLAEPDEIEEEPEPAEEPEKPEPAEKTEKSEEPEDHEAKAEEEVKAPVVDGDPNKSLSADEIAALFATSNDISTMEKTDEEADDTRERSEEKTPEDIKKEVELDLNNSDDLDVLLGIKDKDVTEIIDEMHTDDDDLAEISDLLKKSDANELVDTDDMLAVLQQGMNSSETQQAETEPAENRQVSEPFEQEDAEAEEETGKKRKKKKEKKEKKERKSIFPWKRKKEEEQTEELAQPANETVQNREAQDLDADEAFLDAFMAASEKQEEGSQAETSIKPVETSAATDAEEAMSPDQLDQLLAKEGKDGKAKETGKKGFLSKIFSSLLEEVEEELPEEGEAEDKAADKKAKKEKKKKDKKGKKAADADDNGAILEEMDAEGDGKKKKKPKKEKKPKKPKEPKKPSEEDGKKLPKKPVIRIFVLSFSLMVMIILIANILPGVLALSNARKAFYEKDYLTTYQEMIGKKLNESDSIILEKSTIILKVQRKYSAYKNFLAVGMKPQALNALLEGQAVYEKLKKEAEDFGILDEVDDIHDNIVAALEDTFGVSEERAKEINAMQTDLAYTKAIRQILGMEASPESAMTEKQTESATKETEPVEETDPMEEYEDILPEELQ